MLLVVCVENATASWCATPIQGRAEGRVEGRAEGEAAAVLTVLNARGIAVPEDAHARITECKDLDQLDTWIRRAATADTIDDLFA